MDGPCLATTYSVSNSPSFVFSNHSDLQLDLVLTAITVSLWSHDHDPGSQCLAHDCDIAASYGQVMQRQWGSQQEIAVVWSSLSNGAAGTDVSKLYGRMFFSTYNCIAQQWNFFSQLI